MTYKDMVREDALEKLTNKKTKESKMNSETPIEEQERLKKEFSQALKKQAKENDDDELFSIKKKTKIEKEIFDKDVSELQKTIPKNQEEVLNRYWKESATDPNEKFLKEFIFSKGWIDKTSKSYYDDEIDNEDEDRDSEMEEFEEKYNFRFQEPGGTEIQSNFTFLI